MSAALCRPMKRIIDEIDGRDRAAKGGHGGAGRRAQCGKPGMPMTSVATRTKMADAQKARWLNTKTGVTQSS
jgi:hypothetical protein